jgi:hypothetical protein
MESKMPPEYIIVPWFLAWLAFSAIIGVFASQRRNRNGFGWFLIALFISPMLAFPLVAAMKEPRAARGPSAEAKAQQLFYDALTPEAKVRVDEAQQKREVEWQAAERARFNRRRLATWIVLAVIVAMWIIGANSGAHSASLTEAERAANQAELEQLLERQVTITKGKGGLACKSESVFLDIMDRTRQLNKEGDKEAIFRLLDRHLANGDCRILKDGTIVTPEQIKRHAATNDTTCVRPQGDDQCYWTTWSVVLK